jgi:MFS family permease
MNRDLNLLFASRALRSLSQGYMAVVLPLYVVALGYSAIDLGMIAAVNSLANALVALAVGVLADRFGRKLFMVLISLMMAISGVLFCLSHALGMIVVAASLGTYGGGGGAGRGGAWGPLYPAAQALIAEHASPLQRTRIFGQLSFVGVLASAVGSLTAYLPQFLHRTAGYTLLEGYNVLFILTAIVGVAMALVVLPVSDTSAQSDPPHRLHSLTPGDGGKPRAQRYTFGMSAQTWRIVVRFMTTNLVNGVALGMISPFLVLWFHRRYGVGAGEIGGLFFVINLMSAVPFLMAGRMAHAFGAVRTVVGTRIIGSVLLLLMALMPSFWLASIIYALRTICNTLAAPVRQSYLMGVIEPSQRAGAAGFANSPAQVGTSISPFLAGYLMEHVWLGFPLAGGAAFQLINGALYWLFFRNLHPPEEIEDAEPGPAPQTQASRS